MEGDMQIVSLDPVMDAVNSLKAEVMKIPVTGTITNNAGDTPAVSSHRSGTSIHVVPAAGYTDGTDDASVITDADFVAGKIKAGENIFGLAGTYVTPITGDAVVADVRAGKLFYKDDATAQLEGTATHFEDGTADAVAGDIALGKIAYVNGVKIVGTYEA
jgi:hypothetical protein